MVYKEDKDTLTGKGRRHTASALSVLGLSKAIIESEPTTLVWKRIPDTKWQIYLEAPVSPISVVKLYIRADTLAASINNDTEQERWEIKEGIKWTVEGYGTKWGNSDIIGLHYANTKAEANKIIDDIVNKSSKYDYRRIKTKTTRDIVEKILIEETVLKPSHAIPQ